MQQSATYDRDSMIDLGLLTPIRNARVNFSPSPLYQKLSSAAQKQVIGIFVGGADAVGEPQMLSGAALQVWRGLGFGNGHVFYSKQLGDLGLTDYAATIAEGQKRFADPKYGREGIVIRVGGLASPQNEDYQGARLIYAARPGSYELIVVENGKVVQVKSDPAVNVVDSIDSLAKGASQDDFIDELVAELNRASERSSRLG